MAEQTLEDIYAAAVAAGRTAALSNQRLGRSDAKERGVFVAFQDLEERLALRVEDEIEAALAAERAG